MDAKAHPYGVLEEMEKGAHEMEKSAQTRCIQQQRRYPCLLKKGLLANSR